MPRAQNQIQIVDTHETSETLAVTRLQRVGYQINRTLLKSFKTCVGKARLLAQRSLLPLGKIRSWVSESLTFSQHRRIES